VAGFLGEYEIRLDSKGRIKLPAALLKQIPSDANNKFVINRGFEQHLVIYPRNEWEKITADIDKLNTYNRKTREFRRFFYRGANELILDSAERILLPKSLLDWAKIDKDIILFAHTNMIEVWNKEAYDSSLSNEPEDFASLAETVMGTQKENEPAN
jgi:MraZ protein